MSPALFAQILLMVNESLKVAELLKSEGLTPEQEAQVKAAVQRANDLWEAS